MKKLSPIFGLALVALVGVIVSFRLLRDASDATTPRVGDSVTRIASPPDRAEREADGPAAASAPADPDPDRERTEDMEESEVATLRREAEAARTELDRITRPLRLNVLSSTVSAEIRSGETLVTGGYRTPDGNYELTFLTPRRVVLESGREAIEISGSILAVGSGFVDAHGLETIATNARNTLQHAEAWMEEDAAEILSAARGTEEANLLSSPNIVVASSKPFSIAIGESNGALYSLEATVTSGADGGFEIESRIERTPIARAGAEAGQADQSAR